MIKSRYAILIWVFLLSVFLFVGTASAKIISFEEQYQDYVGLTHKYTSYNILLFPMYQIIDNGNNWTISRQGTTVDLPKQFIRNGTTFNVNYQFLPDRIIPSIQINNYSQISTFVVKVNATVWYLPFPWSASQVKSVTDDLIDMGVFKRTTSLIVLDSNTIPNSYQVVPKVIGGDIRLYFNPQTYSGVVYPLTLTENTITVSNATTSGFTSANVTFDGVRWTDSGQVAINLRNDSSLNMSGLVGYWSMDENTGTFVHNINTESGLVNTTNQGTWNGNATLNYSTGKIGNALAFDGVDDYVDAGNNASVNLTGDMTLEAWIYPISLGYLNIIGTRFNRNDNTKPYDLYFDADKKVTIILGNGTGYININSGYNSVILNNQSYIVATVSGTTITLYVNSIMKSQGTFSGTRQSLAKLTIGQSGFNTRYFNGSIDEVRIFNRALSASEIAVLYNTSMRSQGNLTILNQSASAGNVINRTRIVYSGQDSINNASLDATQNGTSNWFTVQENMTSNVWYPHTNQFNTLDFRVRFNGNGSSTSFFTGLEWDETLASTPTIISWGNNQTNNANITIAIPKNTVVNFNVTSDIVSTNWHWVAGMDSVDGNGTLNSNGINNFTSVGTYYVTVYGNNSIGYSNVITWTVTVQGLCCYNLSGYITNVLGLNLENARVDVGLGFDFTNTSGYYAISGIDEGDYTVVARAIGYRNATDTRTIDSDTVINFTLNERKTPVKAPGFNIVLLFISLLSIYLYMKRGK